MLKQENIIVKKIQVSGYYKYTKAGKKFWVSPHVRILKMIPKGKKLSRPQLVSARNKQDSKD